MKLNDLQEINILSREREDIEGLLNPDKEDLYLYGYSYDEKMELILPKDCLRPLLLSLLEKNTLSLRALGVDI